VKLNDNNGMKIAFVGDSFCAEFSPDDEDINYDDIRNQILNANITPEKKQNALEESRMLENRKGYLAWTQLLLEHYQATPIQKGISGDCFFHSFLRLLPVVDDADLVIICVSEPDRIANHELAPMSIWAAERGPGILKGSDNLKTLYKASLDYYKHIYNPDFHMISHLGILRTLDDLLLAKNKKCIWFGSFRDSFGDTGQNGEDDDRLSKHIKALLPYKVKSGINDYRPLIEISEKNQPQIPYSNHFTKEQNEDLFEYIKNIIDNELFAPKKVK